MNDQELAILYRGMRIGTREWVYGYLLKRKDRYYICTNDNVDFMVVSPDGAATLKLIEVAPETVGGYTSVNDMNDIKVFQGDIVENTVGPGSPFIHVYHNLVIYENGSYFADGFCNIETYDFEHCKVIGNVYETPELLDFTIE